MRILAFFVCEPWQEIIFCLFLLSEFKTVIREISFYITDVNAFIDCFAIAYYFEVLRQYFKIRLYKEKIAV